MSVRASRFARAFESWTDLCGEMNLSGRQMQVLLKLMETMERNSKGDFIASRPREDIAYHLKTSEEVVKKVISQLKKLGILKPLGKAYPTKAQKYILFPRDGAGKNLPRIVEKMGVPNGNKGGTKRSQMGVPNVPIRGDQTVPPTRLLDDSGSGSLSRPTAQENERQEAARRRYAERLRNVV